MGKIPFKGIAGAMALGITENRRTECATAVKLSRTVCNSGRQEREDTGMRCAQASSRVLPCKKPSVMCGPGMRTKNGL